MVNNNQSGFRDWLIQRVSAILIGAYVIFLLIFIAVEKPVQYSGWHMLFSNVWMKIFSLVILISIIWHAWIGLWTIFTDYVKPKGVRLFLEIAVWVLFVIYFIWAIEALFFAAG